MSQHPETTAIATSIASNPAARRKAVALLVALARRGNTEWARDAASDTIGSGSDAAIAESAQAAMRSFRPSNTQRDQRMAARIEAMLASVGIR